MMRSTGQSSAASKKMRRQILLGWLFAAVWSAFVLGFDAFFVSTAFQQVRSGQTWQQTMGTIDSSQIVTGTGAKGRPTYRPRVTYSYSSGGKGFTGDAVEVADAGSTTRERADRIVRSFPPGSTRPVYFDPTNPARSALLVGLQPGTLLMLLLSLPFNAVLLGGVSFLLRAQGFADNPIRKWLVRDDGNRAVMRLTQWSAATVGCLAMGVISFIGIFYVMIRFGGDPPQDGCGTVIGASLTGGLLAYVWQVTTAASGKRDLEIDRALRRISLPRGRRYSERPSIRFDRVTIAIGPDSNRKINNQPAWKLVIGESETDPQFTQHWLSRQDARRIADWIARECGVSVRVVGRDEDEEEDSDAESLTSRPKS